MAVALPSLLAGQQPPEPKAGDGPSPAQIKQQIEKIKAGLTVTIMPADGMEGTEGETVIRVDNPSPFSLIVLLLGPTTQRVEVKPDRMQVLNVAPGDYEIAVTVAGRDVPPFYGRQTVLANMRYRHRFVVPVF